MAAQILHFPPRFAHNTSYSDFRKALMAVTVLEDFTGPEGRELLALWRQHGLLNADEAQALCAFCGWDQPALLP